jgi:hypothetical protein
MLTVVGLGRYYHGMVEKLLATLERYDTYPAEDALRAAFADLFSGGPGADAAQVVWNEWITHDGSGAWDLWVEWAEQRLNAWHSLKVNALETAWQFDPTGADIQGMLKAVLVNLRQGVHDHPELLPDAHFMQALAQDKHSFSFTQVIRELRSSDIGIPAEDAEIRRHCLVCANAFKFFVTA